jgi:hypothetical protein
MLYCQEKKRGKRNQKYANWTPVNSAAGIVCQIFTNDDCTGYAWEVRTDIQQFYGYFENGLRSFQCFQNS